MTDRTGDQSAPPICCGEPKKWVSDTRYRNDGYWRCRESKRVYERQRYERLDGVAYNRLLLKHRRHKALTTRRNREAA